MYIWVPLSGWEPTPFFYELLLQRAVLYETVKLPEKTIRTPTLLVNWFGHQSAMWGLEKSGKLGSVEIHC